MISVLIRTHNDGQFLGRVLKSLLSQKLDDTLEIICCDDHSQDDSPAIAAACPEIRRIAPPEGKYVPGKTLNHLVRLAAGDIVVFNNGDAVPCGDDYLARLTAPLRDGRAEVVFANQMPRPDAWPLVRKDYLRAFGDGRISAGWPDFFSLVSSGFKKETLLRQPFDESFQYSEDVAWIHQRQIKPFYVAGAVVEHSHNYTPAEVRRRFRGEGIADRQMGKNCPGLAETWKRIAAETIRDWIWLCSRKEWKEMIRAPFYRWNQKMAYYRGTQE